MSDLSVDFPLSGFSRRFFYWSLYFTCPHTFLLLVFLFLTLIFTMPIKSNFTIKTLVQIHFLLCQYSFLFFLKWLKFTLKSFSHVLIFYPSTSPIYHNEGSTLSSSVKAAIIVNNMASEEPWTFRLLLRNEKKYSLTKKLRNSEYIHKVNSKEKKIN